MMTQRRRHTAQPQTHCGSTLQCQHAARLLLAPVPLRRQHLQPQAAHVRPASCRLARLPRSHSAAAHRPQRHLQHHARPHAPLLRRHLSVRSSQTALSLQGPRRPLARPRPPQQHLPPLPRVPLLAALQAPAAPAWPRPPAAAHAALTPRRKARRPGRPPGARAAPRATRAARPARLGAAAGAPHASAPWHSGWPGCRKRPSAPAPWLRRL